MFHWGSLLVGANIPCHWPLSSLVGFGPTNTMTLGGNVELSLTEKECCSVGNLDCGFYPGISIEGKMQNQIIFYCLRVCLIFDAFCLLVTPLPAELADSVPVTVAS